MTLVEYQEKRHFDLTPEPAGERGDPETGSLRFVVQKHDASHLHYDFRLEMEGVLKSWAVPKGPSMNPAHKRLAMMVEDHPFDYRDFEGIIPAGNYGAGTVIVWDEGTYHAPGVAGRAENERKLLDGLGKGKLEFVLEGHKLHGEFHLVRTKGRGGDNSWLLFKKDDKDATTADVTEQDRSVKTGRSLDEVAQGAGSAVWTSNKGKLDQSKLDLRGARKGAMPAVIKPMLATLAKEPFNREGWFFELKWDGYRAIANITGGQVRLYSRNDKDFGDRYPDIVRELRRVPGDSVLDGEVVVLDPQGRPSFPLLQNYLSTGEGALVYYVFDLLYLNGQNLMRVSLRRRKEALRALLPDLPHVRYSDHIEEQGDGLFQLAVGQELEGIIAKDAASLYEPGTRSSDWLKIKSHLQQEAVIGGYTEPRGGRKELGALVLGVYQGDDLVYIGHTGGGFDEKSLAEVHARLEPLAVNYSPFRRPPKTNAPVQWVKPYLVCEVRFAEWSQDNLMRQPIFLGLREDKDPKEVTRERPVSTKKILSAPRQREQQPNELRVEIDGHELKLTNLNKVLWPKDGYTKRDLIEYYRKIAPVILPYLRDRPQVLHRFPDGIEGENFYQKDVDNRPPDWVEKVGVESESDERELQYLVCQDEATLTYMANLGCIEINPWNARINNLDNPDYMVMDLDPEGLTFDHVIQVALVVHEVLDAAGSVHYVKTSGATGLHIMVPLGGRYDFEQTRQFANIVAFIVNGRLPDITSLERSPANRQEKIYLDYLQNRRGQTMTAPYSLRPRPGAPVSTPLRWDEVKPGLTPGNFTIQNIFERLEEAGDLWKPVLGPGVDMAAALQKLEKYMHGKA